ncbi:MAG: TetR/AcrR family transcriptional regulator [Lachnospiraceae bacterium]|nr:TetR/AcrR family transcriptional regulator [Lachnospiraceae bacterium]
MYKKLSEDQIRKIIESGIDEFAAKGLAGASLVRIAGNAGVSVGVIYKYYKDKDDLFLSCVRFGLKELTEALKEVAFKSDDLEESLKSVVHTLIHHSKAKTSINRMYNEITSGGASQYAVMLAREIEEISALVYTDLLRKAKEEGMCEGDFDPALSAFFMDNLFMMLQFSYSCDYYRERMRLYCGDGVSGSDEIMERELVGFLKRALGIKKPGA